MSKITLVAIHENNYFSPGAWENTTWTIRDNKSVIANLRYNMNDSKDRDISIRISDDDYDKIFELLEEGKAQDKKIFALDGDGWAFKQFDEDAKIYERRHGYIYDIEGFEKLERLLYKIIKMRVQEL